VSRVVTLIVGLALCGLCTGCSTSDVKPYSPTSKNTRTLFMPSYTTAGAEPVYVRTKWVHPPEVLPPRSAESASSSYDRAPALRPVYELNLKNATLEQTCKVLASMARYSSYTSPSLATQKISFQNLGTIDELARIIESKARVQVVVDHENREVRFLAAQAEQPRFFEE